MQHIPSKFKFKDFSRKKEVVRLWLRLSSCERSIEQALRSHISENFDVTLPQFEVLCELHRRETPVVMSRLSERLNVTSSNLTGIVDRLERKGLVKRVSSSKDRRIQRIQMRSAGLTTYTEIAADNALWVARAFTELTDNEVLVLQKLLLKASASATKALA